MVNLFSHFAKFVRMASKILMAISQGLLAILMFLSITDVIGRYLFNRPIFGTLEMSEILLVSIVFFGSAYTLYLDKQITMELLYTRLSPSAKKIVNVITRLMAFIIFGLMVWKVTEKALYFKGVNRLIPSLLWPIYPFMLFVSLGAILISLELLIQIVYLFMNPKEVSSEGEG
jgi:TRAP-type C4-dicarboxylate transport system permease small subunit